MSGWLTVAYPEADPERVHVVPAKGGDPDPVHEPRRDCPCKPRIAVEFDLDGRRREIVVHGGPN